MRDDVRAILWVGVDERPANRRGSSGERIQIGYTTSTGRRGVVCRHNALCPTVRWRGVVVSQQGRHVHIEDLKLFGDTLPCFLNLDRVEPSSRSHDSITASPQGICDGFPVEINVDDGSRPGSTLQKRHHRGCLGGCRRVDRIVSFRQRETCINRLAGHRCKSVCWCAADHIAEQPLLHSRIFTGTVLHDPVGKIARRNLNESAHRRARPRHSD